MATDVKEGHVFHATLTKEALADLLKERFDGARAIVQRVDSADPVTFQRSEVESFLERWTDGRIFNSDAELRWRQTAEGYAVLFLTETDNPPAHFRRYGSPFSVVCPSSKEAHGFLLWGTPRKGDKPRTENIWWEARIPRPLKYPGKPTTEPPKLAYRLYLDGATVRWVRLIDFVEV